MQTQELIPIQKNEITFEQLPPLLPQQRTMLDNILNGDNYTDAYRKAGYKSEYAKQAALVLISRNPLKAHLDYFFSALAKNVTPEYIINKLTLITERAMNINDEKPTDYDIAIKAIAEINKMLGNYAQTQSQVNHLHASMEDIRTAKAEYRKDK